ncbi:hypothetical protein DRQ15_11135 [candidate division KSB1 bacterium]|nr:MAG: hypothetical protein DRQ15_11135 [candidate division KSB1 bacterium]
MNTQKRTFCCLGLLLFLLLLACAAPKVVKKKESPEAIDRKITKLQLRLRENPSDYSAFFALGKLYLAKGDSGQAVCMFDSSLQLNSSYLPAGLEKGKILYAQGKKLEAYNDFLRILEIDTTEVYLQEVGGVLGLRYHIFPITEGNHDNANPVYSSNGQLIAFQSNRNGNWDVFVMNSEGGEQKQITSNILDEEEPVFSPNGEKIFFARQQAADTKNRDIYVVDLRTGQEKILIQHPADDWYPVMSPDSKWLLFVSDRSTTPEGTVSGIYKYSFESRKIFPLLQGPKNYTLPWPHPFESKFVFTSDATGFYELYLADYKGKVLRLLTQRHFDHGSPRFSPDGKKIVYFSKRYGNFDIYLYDLERDADYRLTSSEAYALSPCFSPEGNHIVFYSNRRGKYQIYVLDLTMPLTRAEMLDQLRRWVQTTTE